MIKRVLLQSGRRINWHCGHYFPNYSKTGLEKSMAEVIKPDKGNSIWKVIKSSDIKSRFYLPVKASKPADTKFIVDYTFTDETIPLALLGIKMDYKMNTPYKELSDMFCGKNKHSNLIIYYNAEKLIYQLSRVPCLTMLRPSSILSTRPLPEKQGCIIWEKGDTMKIDFDFWDGEYRSWVTANLMFGVLGE